MTNFQDVCLCITLFILPLQGLQAYGQKCYTKENILQLREQVRSMFQHAYNGYLKYASGYDELRPLTCDGVDTWGSYSLTLIDSLDTLAVMGNFTEFRRVAKYLEENINFDSDINVSVFETNIRVVGGLLSAHLLSKRAGMTLSKGWPCEGPLLKMAEDVARRLLPAFDTKTGMPYGTVNLRYGVPKGETTITCTAGVGTFLVEFGALSRLTGNPIYENVALNAVHALWDRRSPIGLFGNHIDIQSGRWTALDSGIGAGVDSYFEYFVKGAVLLNRPELLEMFHEARHAIDKYLKRKDWYMWANMYKGQITLPVFQSLEAFWPGLLSLIGDTGSAMRTLVQYSKIWRKYGFLPEFYNIITGEPPANRESYPLRPELIESIMYLYRSTKNQFLLELGEMMLHSIEFSAKTKCGYATIRNVMTHEKQNRMESFFLAETTKYLYLLFDEDNFMHGDGSTGELLETPNGVCAIHSGPHIFNTEAHPIDMSALYCCHNILDDIYTDLNLQAFSDAALLRADWDARLAKEAKTRKYECAYDKISTTKSKISKHELNLSVDIEVFDENDNPAGNLLIENFEKIKTEKQNISVKQVPQNQITIGDLKEFLAKKRDYFKTVDDVLSYTLNFMQNYTFDSSFIDHVKLFDKSITELLGTGSIEKQFGTRPHTLWELYRLRCLFKANVRLLKRLHLITVNSDNYDYISNVLKAFNHTRHDLEVGHPYKLIVDHINFTHSEFQVDIRNTTAMQDFLYLILTKSSKEKHKHLKPFLTDGEISKLALPNELQTSATETFEIIRKLLEFRQQAFETLERLKQLLEQSNPTSTMNTKSTPELKDSLPIESPEVSQENIQSTDNTKVVEVKHEGNNKGMGNQSGEERDSHKNSVWSQLVQTILRKTTTQPNEFNEQELLLKTQKSLKKYANKPARYELFSCKLPTFIERFAYRDFYP